MKIIIKAKTQIELLREIQIRNLPLQPYDFRRENKGQWSTTLKLK